MNGRKLLWVTLVLATGGGCATGYKLAVAKWTEGPGYVGAVQRVAHDVSLDETDLRLELQNLAALRCTADEDRKRSTPRSKSPACKCAQHTDAAGGLADCKAWAAGISATERS